MARRDEKLARGVILGVQARLERANMRPIASVFVALVALAAPALAAEPTGEWLVANGAATIRIENCGGALWGVVASEKEPGVDNNNPDPGKRGRPTLGMPILLGMKPADNNRWDGE